MADTTNHDLLTTLNADVRHIKERVDEIHEGKAGVCVQHATEIKALKSEVKSLFSRQWQALISGIVALVGAVVALAIALTRAGR